MSSPPPSPSPIEREGTLWYDDVAAELADHVELGRDPNKHLAFGLGRHFCLGAALARLEGQVAIGALLRRAADIRMAIPADKLRWRRSLVLRGMKALPVEVR